jgi:hypothetical protein
MWWLLAQSSYTPPSSFDFTTIFTGDSVGQAVAVLGGAALAAVFAVGGGFVVSKKLFSMLFSMMDSDDEAFLEMLHGRTREQRAQDFQARVRRSHRIDHW